MNEIKWRRPGRELSPDEVKHVEKLLSYEFPEDYKTIVKLYHGCSVIPYCIDVNDGITIKKDFYDKLVVVG